MQVKNDSLFETSGFSMWPFLRPSQKLIIKRCPIAGLKPGDIICYRDRNQLVCHRMVKSIKEDNRYGLYVRGDNSFSCPELVDQEAFLGKVVGVLKKNKVVNIDSARYIFINKIIIVIAPLIARLNSCLKKAVATGLRNPLWNLTDKPEVNHPIRFWQRINLIDRVLIDAGFGRVLEIGCGDGRFLHKLKTLSKISAIWGIDISFQSISAAHKCGFNVIQADSQFSPFKTEAFDAVMGGNGSAQYMDMQLLLKDVYRILKPAGIFAFDTYNKYPLEKIVKNKLMRFFRITDLPNQGIPGGIGIKQFEDYCANSGFSIINVYTVFPLPFYPYGLLLRGRKFSGICTHFIAVIKKELNNE